MVKWFARYAAAWGNLARPVRSDCRPDWRDAKPKTSSSPGKAQDEMTFEPAAPLAPESPKMADLRQQLHEASTPQAQRQVMVNTIIAGRNNEISAAEAKALAAEFSRINAEARQHAKDLRAAAKR